MNEKRLGRRTIALAHPPSVLSFANIGGKFESEGPLADCFDETSRDSFFGEKTWEKAESAMQKRVLQRALEQVRLKPGDLDYILGGDLLNQCIGSSFGLRDFGIPFFGLYGACSTMGEGLSLAALLIDGGYADRCAAITSSHFCTAERQYRMPVPYGSQRPPTAQWTATASGCTILSSDGPGPYITHVTCGKIVDFGITDANNMGAAMAPANVRLDPYQKQGRITQIHAKGGIQDSFTRDQHFLTAENHDIIKIKSADSEGVHTMSDLIAKEYKCFEDIKHIRSDGSEYWCARELALVLDYTKWENFHKVIKRAMIACQNSGRDVFECFPEVRKTSPMPNGGIKTLIDYELSRYACYLIVQNGDPRKEVIALGQTYFAIQTYRQEVADRFNQLDEDSRRLVVRGDIKQWNQLLAETARNAGVITNEEFAIFQNAGYMGLYGGLTVDDIHKKKNLAVGQKILDYMGSTELIANLFRISQTEEKLRKDETHDAGKATATHYAVGQEVRKAIEKIGGTMPEDLPTPEKSIAQIEKEQMERLKQKALDGQLMLDE